MKNHTTMKKNEEGGTCTDMKPCPWYLIKWQGEGKV